MTPRRSSRARGSQAPPSAIHSSSSSSITSLGRIERNTRSNNKLSSPRRSSTHLSQSVDDADARSRHDLPQTRQRNRGRDDEDTHQPPPANDEYDEEDGDEEEITRCICGQQDYPGLPPSSRETIGRSSLKAGVKEESNQDPSAAASEILSDDAGSLFIQCDSCKVWQHGGCVGIMEEALSPDEYFCEKCRKDLHRVIVSGNGQKSSQYLPVAGTPSPISSASSTRDNSRSARDKKSRDNADAPKRRSTMNSREAAYEEELLRRAIEESKEESKSIIEETNNRRGKRTRSDSEITKQTAKRQRTSSPSPSSIVSKQSQSQSQPVSEDEKSRAAVNGNKKTRERRKADDSEPEANRQPKILSTAQSASTNSPRRGQSRDGNGDSPPGNGANGVHVNGGESGKPSRPRYMNPNRTTMNDMRRRVAAILEFISRMQLEMAATEENATPHNAAGANGSQAPDSSTVVAALEGAVVNGNIQAPSVAGSAETTQESATPKPKEFKDLSSVEMMDELTRGLLKWQQEFGKYGEK
ncbi:hypothetical protein CISG_00789 [Coccidioides immitis RMSCC 3703]|uniref:Zinc finger PHD-type domain-containing protein n=1 Tax=Coccidioides immitis RMSCC 3703 TaxID=454286 RepID=A0A0J8QQK4_COCIT|nr:hypothetical protein CISG_00789 [Coccidioides immitis RMSCC 3703]